MAVKLTRHNIAYDLTVSPHFLEVPYEFGTVTYMFSSEFYKNKFYESFLDFREKINASISKRFGFEIKCELIADMKLYSDIEKRGFMVRKDDEVIEWQKDIILGGMNLTKKN